MADEITLERTAELILDFIPGLFRNVFRPKGADQVDPSRARERLLGALSARGALSLTELARSVGVQKSNLSPLVEQLVREGAVERYVDERDRRVTQLTITLRGKYALAEARTRSRDRLAARLSVLSEAEQDELLACLESLVTLFEKISQENSE